MLPQAIKQACLATARIITVIVCLSAVASAQTPSPQPSPSAPPTNTVGSSFSQTLERMRSRATELLPLVRNEIEGPLLPWLENLSLLLASLIIIAAFARLWRENGGAGVDLFWWFARLGVIFALLGNGPRIVDGMFVVGRELAGGVDASSALHQFCVKQRSEFDAAYEKFTEGVFTVKDTSVKPVPGGMMGVIYSTETSVLDATRKFENLSKDMSFLFDSLNFSRGVITFGDFFLTLLGSFLLIAMRLSAPIMIALAIDRSVAQKITYPYAWGVAVLTLIWPFVVLLIKSIAYMGGNIAMALGNNQQFYAFDPKTMQIIQNSSQQPVYTVLFAAAIMLIAGLCLWGAPYIAYQLSVGRVYEGVSTTISSWAGQIAGAGIEYYSSSMAASISRQAEVMQAQSQYFAESTRAGAQQEGADTQARGNKIRQLTGVESSRVSGLYAAESARYNQSASAKADELFARQSTDAGVKLQQGLAGVGAAQQREDLRIGIDQQRKHFQADAESKPWEMAHSVFSNAPLVGPYAGYAAQMKGAGNRLGIESKAAEEAYVGRFANTNNAFAETSTVHGNYGVEMKSAIEGYSGNRQFVADMSAQISKDGVNRSASIAKGGVIQGYNLDLQANRINYEGAIKAATHIRDTAVEAAKLRSVASIIGSVGHNIARDMEQGLTLRY